MKTKPLQIFGHPFGAFLLFSALAFGNCGEDAIASGAACIPVESKPASILHEIFIPTNMGVRLNDVWTDGNGPDAQEIVSAGLLKSCSGKTIKLSQPGTTKYISVPSFGLGGLPKSSKAAIAITSIADDDLIKVDLFEEITGANCPPCYGAEQLIKAFFDTDETEQIRKSLAYIAWHDAGVYDSEVSMTPRRKSVNSTRTPPGLRILAYGGKTLPTAALNGRGGSRLVAPKSVYTYMLNNLKDEKKVHPLGEDSGVYTFVSGTHLQQGTQEEEDDDDVLVNVSVYNSTDDSIDSFMNIAVLMNDVPIPEGTDHFSLMNGKLFNSGVISHESIATLKKFNFEENPTEYQHLVRECSIGDKNTVTIYPGINLFTYVVSLAEDGWESIPNPGKPTMIVTAWLQNPSFKDQSSPVISAGQSDDVYTID